MQTMKSDSKSKKSGKGAAAEVIVAVAVTPETQGQTSAETAATQDSGAEVQASVAPTVPVQQEEPLVQLLDLNKIVSSTYNPRKEFREETQLELGKEILEVTEANCDDFFGQNGQQYFGRLVILRGVTCRYGTVGSNIYPAWMYTDIRPVMNKVWYRWAFSNDGTNLYGSVLFTYDSTLPSTTNKKGVYTVRTSGYSRFAQYPVVRDGAKGDIMAIFGIYSKNWTYNYGAYQCTVNYFDDITRDKDAFLTEAEVEELHTADSWVTPDPSDDEYTD